MAIGAPRPQDEDDDLGEADGAERVADGELLELALDPRPLAQARRIEQA